VTGHDENGKAVIESDGPAPNVKVREGAGFVSTLLWVTDETPAKAGLRIDRAERTIAVAPPANGSILRIVDFPPVSPEVDKMDGAALLRAMGVHESSAAGAPSRHAYMHRTKSVDYGIVLSGEIDMLLDDSEVHLKARRYRHPAGDQSCLGQPLQCVLPDRLHPDRCSRSARPRKSG